MATIVPVRLDDNTTIYVEAADSANVPGAPAIKEASAAGAAGRAIATAQELSSSVTGFCRRIMADLRGLEAAGLTKASVEFGLSISLEGNVYVVKASGEASVKITAEWELADDKARQ